MCWLGIIGVFIVLYKSTYGEKYSVSGNSTTWREAECTKAKPILSYNNFVFEVNELIGKLPTSDVWIGYFKATVPFYFHGCAVVQQEQTYRVTSIGYCNSICVHTELFGIQTNQGNDMVNAAAQLTCRCVTRSIDSISYGTCDGERCVKKDGCYAVFSQITVNVYIQDTENDKDCLVYYNEAFSWQACTRSDSIKTLCSSNISTDPSSIAVIQNKAKRTWIEGNAVCLEADWFPATLASVNNTQLDTDEKQQCYWMGIIRADTLLRGDPIDSTYHSDVSYGFLDGHTGKLDFTRNGIRPALCASEVPIHDTTSTESHTPIRGVTQFIEGQTTTRDVTQSTEGQVSLDDATEATIRSRKSLVIEIGIGVTVTVLVVVVVVIIVFRRRKILLQFTNLKRPVMMSANSDYKANCQVSVETALSDNNVHEKEKLSFLENKHLDHKNTANDPNVAVLDAHIYHTVNDAVEPLGNETGDTNDYDYTTTKVVQTERDPDKVYNKLKLERHGDYNHVKGNYSMQDQPTGNHYDTASVSCTENAALASVYDDYDHVEGKGRIHIAEASNDYAMTASAMEFRAGSASGKDDEGEYNHISNLHGPTHEESTA